MRSSPADTSDTSTPTGQRDRAHIQSHGLAPLRRLLLVGPPGTGKTMTAAALAGELSIPLFSIQLHSLITKYLGETAATLRLVFDAMQETRAVYLFDEFDALGTDRAAEEVAAGLEGCAGCRRGTEPRNSAKPANMPQRTPFWPGGCK